MGFTEKTLGFISENYMRNDREWFKEHKGDYEALVLAPFAELLETLAPVMEKIDDKLYHATVVTKEESLSVYMAIRSGGVS